MPPNKINIVVLISGRGSNLQSIIDHTAAGKLAVNLCAVICNNADAQGLQRAHAADIPTHTIEKGDYASKQAYENALIAKIDSYAPQLLVLAGYMLILSDNFVNHYADKIINIHPSLLPQFPGLDTHRRVLQSGQTQHGASVHFVTVEVDAGPIITQARVPVLTDDTVETLAARVLEQEHRIYPLAIQWFAEGRLQIENGRVLLDGQLRTEQGFTAD